VSVGGQVASLRENTLGGPEPDAPARIVTPAIATSGIPRELRLDLFRGLALWLIFIDHLSPDVLTWFTIRNYGFSDAAEIFIFISGYTAALVYGRAMQRSGFLVAASRILKRVWQIYAAHLLLFTIYLGEITFLAARANNPFYLKEMGITGFFQHPDVSIAQALVLRFCPLNMDVLPLYIVLMFFLPPILWVMKWRPDMTLALSIVLYALMWKYDLYLTAYPKGFWTFNPYAWQLLFVFGVWCALGGAQRLTRFIRSPVALWISLAYLLAAFGVTLTWYFPQLEHIIPARLEQWIYPIDKTDLDTLRFLHFLALAAITVRFVPKGWPGLTSPWARPLILCGQHSLRIYCLGVFLSFAGYFVLTETDGGLGLHAVVAALGIAIMTAVAWMFTWYKRVIEKGSATSVPA
jgi:hypothetical protein